MNPTIIQKLIVENAKKIFSIEVSDHNLRNYVIFEYTEKIKCIYLPLFFYYLLLMHKTYNHKRLLLHYYI